MYVIPSCLLLLSSIFPVSAVHVTGVVGGEVILPCTVNLVKSQRQSEYSTSSVRWWRKDGNPRTVHKLLPSGVTFIGLQAKSRAFVPPSLLHQGIFSLHIKNLTERDAGKYDADAKYGSSMNSCSIILRTIKVIQSPHGPLPEKSSVKLTCRIVDPDHSSTTYVRWLHHGKPVQPSNRISVNGNSLYLHSLTQEDDGNWSCEVDGARSSVTLMVVGIFGPNPLSIYAAIGSSVELPCNFTHLPIEKRCHWSKDANSIYGNNQVLVLNHVRPEDAGTYRCDATYKSQSLTRHIELRVIQVSPSGPMFTKEGAHLQLLCNISGSTEKERFQWTGPSLPDGQRIVIKGPEVDLTDVSVQDSGAWTCSVYGTNGILGEVEHWVYVHAAQTAGVGSFTSWHVILILILILVSSLAVIAFISFRNHKRRLSHLRALASTETSSVSHPKKVSVSEC